MGEYALLLRDAGANIIGGCCGSTPLHIKAMADVLQGLGPIKRKNPPLRGFASRSKNVLIGDLNPLAYIGERINPTARKKLAEEIKNGQMEMVVEEAKVQVEAGAPMLDVNMGVPGIDEAKAMAHAVTAIQNAVDIPIALDSTNVEAIEEGLKNYVGRPLINSTTAEDKNLALILPLAKKYGAAILGLCIDEAGIPDTAAERLEVARKIYDRAKEYGLRDEDIYIDTLVKTASAEQAQVMETIEALTLVKSSFNVGTVLGLSNVSHGLPSRDLLNSTYLAMAWSAGLDLPIMNPLDEQLMDTTRAAQVLLNRDENCIHFINTYKEVKAKKMREMRSPVCEVCNIPDVFDSFKERRPGQNDSDNTSTKPLVQQLSLHEGIKKAVLEGNVTATEKLVDEALVSVKDPLEIVNDSLIPGIEEAGIMYDKKLYFLPQLMMAAEAMKVGFAKVKPHLADDSELHEGVIVLATVEGDIHDIGKNIVAVLLENYGFKVVDLGKDVKTLDIIKAAIEHEADIIGLSALMTTTMPRMAEVVQEVKNHKLRCKIMVGGAVLTPEYASSIGADAYSSDARNAVVTAKGLLKNTL